MIKLLIRLEIFTTQLHGSVFFLLTNFHFRVNYTICILERGLRYLNFLALLYCFTWKFDKLFTARLLNRIWVWLNDDIGWNIALCTKILLDSVNFSYSILSHQHGFINEVDAIFRRKGSHIFHKLFALDLIIKHFESLNHFTINVSIYNTVLPLSFKHLTLAQAYDLLLQISILG